jgi:hypothetical protein
MPLFAYLDIYSVILFIGFSFHFFDWRSGIWLVDARPIVRHIRSAHGEREYTLRALHSISRKIFRGDSSFLISFLFETKNLIEYYISMQLKQVCQSSRTFILTDVAHAV